MKLVVAGLLLAFQAQAQVHWSYEAPTGPAQWGLMPGFETCAQGAEQSPIAIEAGQIAGLSNVTPDDTLPALDPAWSTNGLVVTNNGHTIQVNATGGGGLDFEGKGYGLKQFHFHSPSEHTLNERQYPLEAHFVHADAAGNLLVVGVFFKVGASNPVLESVWRNAPVVAGGQIQLSAGFDPRRFLPAAPEFFTYAGSLTTPPCSEGVRWIVMANPLEASAEQLRFLQKTMGGPNNRPVQPLDGRVIRQENSATTSQY